jgi:hypothetical protein
MVCQSGDESVNVSVVFLISNFHYFTNVVFFLLGDFPASAFYVPTFLNTLFHRMWCKLHTPSMKMEQAEYSEMSACKLHTPSMKMEQAEYSEMSACKMQTPENHPKERIQHFCSVWEVSCRTFLD